MSVKATVENDNNVLEFEKKVSATKVAKDEPKVRFSRSEVYMKDKSINYQLYAKLQQISRLNMDTKERFVMKSDINFSVWENEDFKDVCSRQKLSRDFKKLLQQISRLNMDTKERFVMKSDINFSVWENEDFKDVCSRQKLSRDFKKLLSVGLVVETEINNKKAYLLPYDEAEKMFSLIPTLTIKYLLKVKSSYCVKAFIYLLNCYLYKEKINDKYLFTKKELCEVLGLSVQTKNREEIDYILNSLHNEGLISYRSVVAHYEGHTVPYYELLEVRFYVKGLNYNKGKKKTIKIEGKRHIKEEKILPPIEEEKPKETTVNEQIKMTKENEKFFQNWIDHLDIYLLNCYLYKEKINDKYLFTKKELCEVLGLSVQTKNREEIDYILNSLHNEGLISYRSVVAHYEGHTVPYYELLEVRFYVKGLNYNKGKKKTIKIEGKRHIKEEKILPPIEEEKPKETTVNEQIKMTKENEKFFQNWIDHLDKQIKEGKDFIAF